MRASTWIVIVALTGCSSEPPATPLSPPEIRIAQVGATSATPEITATGTIEWRRETSLGFTSPGRIARITPEEGERVLKGDLLATLDATVVNATLNSARAEYDRAAAEDQRSSKLFQQGWVTRERADNARAVLATAAANLHAAKFQTRNSRIIAPSDGVVLARLTEPGQVIAAGTPVLVLGEARDGLVLRVPLTQRDSARIARGAPATIVLPQGGSIAGSVVGVAGRADRATGTFRGEIAIPAGTSAKSGDIAAARILISPAPAQTLVVPASAVFAAREGEGFVYVIDRSTKRALLRKITLGEISDAGVAVISGVARGEWVAVSRLDRLTDRALVNPIVSVR